MNYPKNSNDQNKTLIAAIIGAVAVIIAAIIGAYGLVITQERSIQATQTKEVQSTQSALQTKLASASVETSLPPGQAATINPATNQPTLKPLPTYTPYPTYTIPATAVVIQKTNPPNQTKPTDTPPGTTLQVGETWITNGLYVNLSSITFMFGDEADLEFAFTNHTGRAINLSINHDVDIVMKDDMGNLYTWANHYEKSASINDGQTWNDRVYKGGNLSRAKFFIIKLEIPGLVSAQWKY